MEDIEYLRNCIVYSIGNEETGMTESCEEYKQVMNRVLDRLEQDERVIEEMANYIVDLIKYNNSEEIRDIEEIIDHFRKKCE